METQGYIIPGSHEKEAIDLFYISVNDVTLEPRVYTTNLSFFKFVSILKHSSKTASFS